ncbi:MAG: septal ring lytic transglycosylase RlpA family protein [Ignavibacteriales bacterium]|nr:septal ring lytic transglycosylase RlpA family protein [Ignavibacteriales bacterium]
MPCLSVRLLRFARNDNTITYALCIICLLVCLLMIGCTSSPRFTSRYVGDGNYQLVEEGIASYYAEPYHGQQTSNGEIYDMYKMTAAHQTLPLNTRVKVTNLTNMKTTEVRINDRGPFVGDRIIDLSVSAAKEIDMIGPGTALVRLEVIELGPVNPETKK